MMIEQDLKNIWKRSTESELINFENSKLITDLQGEVDAIKKGIVKRDITEISASVIGMFMFIYLTYEIPFPITKIGCILSVIWFIYLIYKLKKNKNKKEPVDLILPLWEQLEIEKTNMEQEVVLLDTVLYWYVLPPLLANIIFILGFGNPIDYHWSPSIIEVFYNNNILHLLPITLKSKIAYVIGSIVFNAFVLWVNKRTIRKRCIPILNNITNLQKQLKNNQE